MFQTRKIFGLLLNDDRKLLDQLKYGVQLSADDFTNEEDRFLWNSINQAAQANHPILPGVIASLQENISEDYLRELWDEGFGVGAEEAISYARQLVDETDRKRIQSFIQEAGAKVGSGANIVDVQQDLNVKLLQKRGSILQSAKTKDIGERIRTQISSGIAPKITSTGIAWFDYFLGGGFQQRAFIAIGGRQKGRKTSIARNLMLGSSRSDQVSVVLLAYENDQIISYYDLVAMEAARYAYSMGWETVTINEKPMINRLGGAILMNAHQSGALEKWDSRIRECVANAIEVVDGLPIWIYDTKPENGGLDNLSSMLMVMEMHRQLTPADKHLIFFIDYAQLVNNVGKDYEDMKALSSKLLWASQHYDATIIVLTQFNEAANFQKAQDKKAGMRTDFLGTKGGGSLEAAVQNFFVSDYDPREPHILRVEQARSRRSGWGEKYFNIHPASGLITE